MKLTSVPIHTFGRDEMCGAVRWSQIQKKAGAEKSPERGKKLLSNLVRQEEEKACIAFLPWD